VALGLGVGAKVLRYKKTPQSTFTDCLKTGSRPLKEKWHERRKSL
jgi:hypothetical protein